MSKLGRIISGWKNLAFPDKEVEKLADARAEICARCEFAQEGTWEEIIQDRIIEIKGLKCTQCQCPLSTKLRSPKEICPKAKW